MKKKFCLLFLISVHAFGQNKDEKYEQALKLKNENKIEEALPLFEQLLKNDSSKIEYLFNLSFLMSKLGNRQKVERVRQAYFQRAEYLAKKAISVDNSNSEAHYTYALALGRINEYASSKQKIANAKLIKNECDLALKTDPKHPGTYHILGRWHRTVAGFNFMEKAMINTFFGGVPQGGSYKDAIECFSKAVLLEPGYMLHKFELAQTYRERGEKGDDIFCKIWCRKVLEMIPADVDDKETLTKAQELLKKVE